MFKNLFIRIFKRKQYKESLEVIDKLLGIEKSKEIIEIFYLWVFNSKNLVCCYNYKNKWDKPRYKIKYKNYGNFPNMCYNFEFRINFSYYSLDYIRFNF